MNIPPQELEALKERAKAGDRQAIQILRTSGYFEQQKAKKEGYPLSHAQQRLWVLEQMEDGNAAYNIPAAVLLDGPLHLSAFRQAWQTLLTRHESLRTIFKLVNGRPRQFVLDELELPLTEWDWQNQPNPIPAGQKLARQEAITPFNLSEGPLLRLVLVKLAPTQHLFLLTLHHIITDGWSMELLLREFMVLYTAYEQGQDNPLPPLAQQYRHFALYQQEQMDKEAYTAEQNYWQTKLAGSLPVLNLPTDFPRPDVLGFAGQTITAALTQQVSEFCAQQGVTLFMFLTAAVKLLLHRYTGQEDIVIGTPIAGRDRPELENQVGFYVNALALRDSVQGHEPFLTLLQRVAQTCAEAYAHQAYPFDRLVNDLNLSRDMSRNPIFDVLVNVQHSSNQEITIGNLHLSEFDTGYDVAKFDLTFEFVQTEAGLGMGVNFNTHLFAEGTMRRMLDNFQHLLGQILARPTDPLLRLELLSPAELAQLTSFNQTQATYPASATLVTLFEQTVDQHPGRPAVTFGETTWNYAELNQHAAQLAYYLHHEKGLRPGETVAILLDKSYWMVAAILGVLKAGGVYVPLDPDYPLDRLQFMSQDCGARFLLTEATHFALAEQCQTHHQPHLLNLTELWSIPAVLPRLVLPLDPDQPAYIIYTSGSTGRPKGCVVTHRNVVRLMVNDKHQFHFTEQDVWVVAHSFCFDFSVWEMYGALLYGGRVVVAPREQVRDSSAFLELLIAEKVTVLNQTPAAFYNLISAEARQTEHHLHTHLYTVIFGGDRLDPTYVRQWVNWYPLEQIALVNMYGLTETTVHVTYCPLTPVHIWGPAGRSPIGVPIPETTVYVVNKELQQQPLGVVGEILVGGSGVSKGYLNRPELTQERFIPNPFGPGRLYRSGDLGRWMPDGTLEHLGRNDFQVQLRGFRIELGEIEAVINQHPQVEKSVVIARGEDGDKQLLAYCVTRPGSNSTLIPEVRQLISHKLPDYMMPNAFVLLDSFPLTSNGKIDRNALPNPADLPHPDHFYQPPQTPTEETLAQIWQTVLGVEKVGREDDFFALGGHSLKATQILAQVQEQLQVKLTLRDMFRALTIAQLAELIEEQHPAGWQKIPAAPPAASYPLSHAQRRLWVIEQMGVAGHAYHMPVATLLEGELHIELFHQAIQQLVARHESLRTTFTEIAGEPRQIIHPQMEIPLTIEEVSSLEVAFERVQQLSRQLFDLRRGPLLRLHLLQLNPHQTVLLLNMHHIITDGWSLEVMVKELLEVLSEKNLLPTPHSLLPIQYKDYAVWQQNFLASAEAQTQRQFWLELFHGELPVLDLATDKPRPAVQTFRGSEYGFVLPAEMTSKLSQLARQESSTMFMVVLALVKLLLHRYTGQSDLVVGYPTAGRDHPDLAGQIGFYVNMLALRSQIEGENSFINFLGRVRQTVTAAFEHQMYPFDLLVEELNLKRDMGRSPLFDVAVSWQAAGRGSQLLPGLQASEFDIRGQISKFDLTFFFVQSEAGELQVTVEYSTDLFEPGRIQRMGEHVQQLAQAITTTPHRPVNQLNLLSPAERRKVVQEFNHAWPTYPQEQTIAHLFEQQAQKTAQAPAVRHTAGTLTYQELNQQANQLAHYLLEQGVRPEESVGVLLDRSPLTIVALLGILKAGGAYVPIDPNYPQSRVAYIVQDSACRWVLSEEKYLANQLAKVPGGMLLSQALTPHTHNPQPTGSGRSLAYIIYTSGSTGLPKGTLIEQRSVLRLVLNTNYITLTPQTRILQTGSLAFDASTFEIWGALLNGGCLCLPDNDALLSAGALGQLIRQYGITTIFITTSLFNQFVEADVNLFAGLQELYTGGEKVSVGHFNRFRQAHPAVRLYHVYGPTENTTFSTFYPVTQTFEWDVPIGYPLANSSVYILDSHRQPVPIGIAGEICVGGHGVGRGYLNRPELTASKFAPDPFLPGEQMYLTGDLGLWLPDGSVKFIGRIDNQLKIRGFRVEPGEIEHQLLSHPAVREVVVLPRTTTVGTKELLAYFSADKSFTVAELRAYLQDKLPEYMIPAHFMQMAKLPIKITGKIDREALPAPEVAGLASEHSYLAPRTAEEQALAEVWAAVLGRPQIGLDENYFELGGDSIRAIQITSRLLQKGWKLAIQDLFMNPTIGELGFKLTKVGVETAGEEEETGEIPLLPIQQWFFEIVTTGREQFNQGVLLMNGGRINETHLQTALTALVQHHQALQLTVKEGLTAESAKDAKGKEESSEVGNREWCFIPHTSHPTALFSFDKVNSRELLSTPYSPLPIPPNSFDLENGPLFKAILTRLPESDRLLLVAHHLVVDGVSWRILLEDLNLAYAQAERGETVILGVKTSSLRQWYKALEAYLPTAEQELAYWQGVAAARPGLEVLPHTFGQVQEVGFSLSEGETAALLTETHQAYTTEINDLLLTAFGRAWQTWRGGNQLLLTLEGHGREPIDEKIDLSRTVGWFTAMFPFVVQVTGQEVGRDIKQVKESLRRVPAKGVGYGVLRYVAQRPGLAVQPAVSFNYLGQFDENQSQGNGFVFAPEPAGEMISPEVVRPHALDVNGLVTAARLQMSITYYPGQFPAGEVQQLAELFKAQLLEVITHCQQKESGEKTVSDFTLQGLSEEDFGNILDALG